MAEGGRREELVGGGSLTEACGVQVLWSPHTALPLNNCGTLKLPRLQNGD